MYFCDAGTRYIGSGFKSSEIKGECVNAEILEPVNIVLQWAARFSKSMPGKSDFHPRDQPQFKPTVL